MKPGCLIEPGQVRLPYAQPREAYRVGARQSGEMWAAISASLKAVPAPVPAEPA